MSEELALPTKESIRKAAEKCPEAKEVLKELFPSVFSKKIDFKENLADNIIKDLVVYSGVNDDDCDRDEWMPREQYIMARIFLTGIRSGVLDEIERLGPRKFYTKYRYLPHQNRGK